MTLNELNETNGFELGTALESGDKGSNVECGSTVVETGGADANECVNMKLDETSGFELGADLEIGGKDSNVKCDSPVAETGGIDANECVNMTLDETDGFVLGADLEGGGKDSNVKCSSPVVEKCGVDTNECLNMTLDETDGFELGAALESGSKDSNVKCGSPIVETGGVDASMLTSTFNANSVNDGCTKEKIVEDDQIQGHEADQVKSPRSVEEKFSGGESGTEHRASQNSLARERRKSKYLSPPFVDLSKGAKALSDAAEAEVDSSEKPGNKSNQSGKGSSLVKCGRKRQSRKSLTGSFGLMPLTAPSTEQFTKLHLMACDFLAPHYDRALYRTMVFFTRFRASHFSGIPDPVLIGEADAQDEQPLKDEEKQKKTSMRKMKREKRMTGSDNKQSPSGLYNVNVSSGPPLPLIPVIPGPLSNNTKPQRKRKKKDDTIPPPPAPNQTAAIPDLNGNNGEPAKKRRMRKQGNNSTNNTNNANNTNNTNNTNNNNTMTGIICTNGDTLKPIALEVCIQVEAPSDPNITTPPASVSNGSTPAKPVQPTVTKTPEKPTGIPISSNATPTKVTQAGGVNTPEKPSAEPSLDQMKKSLEFMTSMLEKSGNLISPEMRANLESEIQKLLKKVNPMVGPSS